MTKGADIEILRFGLVAADAAGNVYVAGSTGSADFPKSTTGTSLTASGVFAQGDYGWVVVPWNSSWHVVTWNSTCGAALSRARDIQEPWNRVAVSHAGHRVPAPTDATWRR